MSEIITLSSEQTANLDPVSSAFAYGFGLFETIKLSQGRLCLWAAHWQRLKQSAATLGLAFEYAEADVIQAIDSFVDASSSSDGTIKLSLFSDRLYVYSRPALSVPEGKLRLQLDFRSRINEHSYLAGHKTHNYMENSLLLQRCRQQGYYDVLRLNSSGDLAETAVGNLFFMSGETLCTPSLDVGILPGVVRAAVLSIARRKHWDINVGLFDVNALAVAEAVFITNASCGILPIAEVEGLFDGESASHPRLLELSRLLAEAEIEDSVIL